jgi:hypothetical protein
MVPYTQLQDGCPPGLHYSQAYSFRPRPPNASPIFSSISRLYESRIGVELSKLFRELNDSMAHKHTLETHTDLRTDR